MEIRLKLVVWMTICLILVQIKGGFGIRFVMEKEECLFHNVLYEGDKIHVSFVVIKADGSWHYADDGVDLMITGPSGEKIQDFHDKTSEKYEFTAYKRGVHRFCFLNKSLFKETIDFNVYVSHFMSYDQHATNEHFDPLLEQISKLEEALNNIQFEQHWLEAQTERQSLVNESMSQKAMYKAIVESLALVGASFLQVWILLRLFDQKLGTIRV